MQIFWAHRNLKAVRFHRRQIKENWEGQAVKIAKDMVWGSDSQSTWEEKKERSFLLKQKSHI